MKHLKSYKLFESSESEPFAGDATEIIRDHRSEFTDLGFDVDVPVVTSYEIDAYDEETDDDDEIDDEEETEINRPKFISCLYFEISTPLEGVEMVSECYEPLSNLRSHLKSELGLDLSIEMYSDLPLMDLDDVYEVYGATEWNCLCIYIHKPFNRNS